MQLDFLTTSSSSYPASGLACGIFNLLKMPKITKPAWEGDDDPHQQQWKELAGPSSDMTTGPMTCSSALIMLHQPEDHNC